MRANNPVKLIRRECALPEESASVYDLAVRRTESSDLCRIRALEHEKALLMRMVSETQTEIARLRRLLIAP